MVGTVSFVVSGVVLFFILIGLLAGAIRGMKKSAVRFGVVLLAAVLAVSLSVACANSVLRTEIGGLPTDVSDLLEIDGVPQPSGTPLLEAVENVLMADETIADLVTIAPTITAFIMVTPQVLIAETIFVFLFFIIKLLLGIPELILKAIFMRKKEDEKGHHGWGALIGAVQGLFCACVVLVPVFGIVTLLNTAVTAVHALPDHGQGESADLIETIEILDEEFLASLERDPAYQILESVGIKYLCVETFYSISDVTYDGKEISYLREVNDLLPVMLQFVEIGNIDYTDLNEADVAFLSELVSSINHSHLASVTISEVVSNTSNILLDGGTVLGFSIPNNGDEASNTFLHDVLEVLSNAEPESIPGDLPNVLEAIEVLIVYDIFNGEDVNLADLISNQLFTEDFLLALSHSTIMSPIAVSAVNDYGIGMFLDLFNAPTSNEHAYDIMLQYVISVLEEMNEQGVNYSSLSDAERADYIHSASRIFVGLTQGVDNETADMVATAILDAYATADALPTVEMLRDYLNAMDIYALSSEGFVTKMILYQDILVTDRYLFNHMSEKERREEAAHLAATIADVFYLAGVFGDLENIDLDALGPVGKMLDSMSHTQLLASSLDNLLYLFMDTAYTLKALPDGAIDLLRTKIHDHVVNYENLFINIASTFKLANHIDVTGKESTPEEDDAFMQTIENLYNTTDETTLEIAQSIITEDFLVGMGVPAQGASTAQTVFNTFLEEVVNTKTDENTDFRAESEAIESVMTIVSNVSSGETTETLNEELIDAVVASETLTNTIISVSQMEEGSLAEHLDEETIETASAVINDYAEKVAENATPEEAERINACLDALRAMFGLEIPV